MNDHPTHHWPRTGRRARRMGFVLLMIFILALPGMSSGRDTHPDQLPADALWAEQQGDWDEAARLLEEYLAAQPDDLDVWLRLSEVQWARGDNAKVAEALEEACRLQPDDPELHHRRSQAWSVADEPAKALEAIQRALELDPGNMAYLESQGALATWAGDYELAGETYRRMLELEPDHDKAELYLARSQKWGGDLEASVLTYDSYCAAHPDDPDALVEYAIVQAWRGSYGSALWLLDDYRERFGEDTTYLAERARVLAWANRPEESLNLVIPLLQDDPDNHELVYTRTIALHYDMRPEEALDSLARLEELDPDSKVTRDTRTFVTLPLRSNVRVDFDWYTDVDTLDIINTSLTGEYQLTPSTKLRTLVDFYWLQAEEESGLTARDGDEEVVRYGLFVGGQHRFNSYLSVDGLVGWAFTDRANNSVAYEVGADVNLLDDFVIRFQRSYDYYLRSPRSVSLDIMEGANEVSLRWYPHPIFVADTSFRFSTLTDDNSYWQLQTAPRVSILRTQYLNVDVGPYAFWQAFRVDEDHGYYDPYYYELYQGRVYLYWKIDDNNGVGIIGSIGIHRDDGMRYHHLAMGVAGEATFGIYDDLMIKIRAGGTHNEVEDDPAFEAFTTGFTIVYRF